MPNYSWKGVNAKGKRKSGTIDAADERQVEIFLKRLRISDYAIKEAPKDIFVAMGIMPKVTSKDLMIFTRQFSTMIDAGLPIVQCLKLLSEQGDNLTFKMALRDINTMVQSGTTLSDAMRKYPKIFDELYCNLVAAGESAGILDNILKRLSEYIEKAERLKRKVKGALTYPAAILFVAVAVVVVIMVFVIPVFVEIFSGSGKELPKLTQLVVMFSNALRHNAIVIIAITIAAIFALVKLLKTPAGAYAFDSLLLKTPKVNDLVIKIGVSKFTRTLSTMIQAGVPIITSLDIVARTAGNKIIEESLVDARMAISEGRPLTDPLMEAAVFPGMVTQMIAVGEESGALDIMLTKIADFYDEEVDAAIEVVTTLIEPALIVFLGITVGTIVIAMYMPIFEFGQTAGV